MVTMWFLLSRGRCGLDPTQPWRSSPTSCPASTRTSYPSLTQSASSYTTITTFQRESACELYSSHLLPSSSLLSLVPRCTEWLRARLTSALRSTIWRATKLCGVGGLNLLDTPAVPNLEMWSAAPNHVCGENLTQRRVQGGSCIITLQKLAWRQLQLVRSKSR